MNHPLNGPEIEAHLSRDTFGVAVAKLIITVALGGTFVLLVASQLTNIH